MAVQFLYTFLISAAFSGVFKWVFIDERGKIVDSAVLLLIVSILGVWISATFAVWGF